MIELVGPFQKSSYTTQLGECVEVAETADQGRAIRDSKQADGPLFVVSRSTWQDFIQHF
ncbi:DUF397 domain-containing protein [Streptomyces sp. W16]|uniref:DUF397 domain-containing protein n=1 Tax=Streptomyces sp. W16 TaxID=3076631 RepID=UPI00295ACA83|nr:DUF397 domain-containing protein [Streptomyces sp. W16]MDV9169761.1 DUF397 domain-containing protein [Streptomyces sp. W16]